MAERLKAMTGLRPSCSRPKQRPYNAEITGSDGRIHPDRLSGEDTARFSRLYEELGPYLKQLGIMIKPRS